MTSDTYIDEYLAERQAEDDTVRPNDLTWNAAHTGGRYDKWALGHLAEHTRLSMGQTFVLAMLNDHAPRRVSWAAVEARRPKNVLAWRAVEHLRRAGLIEAHRYNATDPRTNERRRLTAYSLTETGRTLIGKADEAWQAERVNRGWY